MANPLIPFQQPTLSQLLSDFGAPAPKREEIRANVEAATEAKRLIHGAGPDGPRLFATAIEEGNNLAQTPLAQDLATLGIGETALRYGMDTARAQQDVNRERMRIREIETSRRDGREQLDDTLLGVATGATAGLGGVAAFGAGLVNDEAGAVLADLTNQATDYLRGNQSGPLQRKREQAGFRAELDRQDIAEQYRQDTEAGASVPGLRRFGREFMRAMEDLYENPTLAADLVAEGVGSLAGSLGVNGIVTRGAAKFILAQRGITGERAARVLATRQGRKFLSGIAQKGMPLSIGALEAGGTYVGIQAEIQAMTEDELHAGSEEYRALREGGLSHEDARNRIASIAALEGGAIQGLVGAATGKLVAKFEADPLGLTQKGAGSFVKTLQEAGSNVLKEGIEEAVQGGSSALASGFAIQRHADAGRDITEGAGTDVAQGLVAGSGMAGVLQTPRVAAVGALAGAQAAGRAARDAVVSRLERVRQETDDESTVGARARAEAAGRIEENVTRIAEAVPAEPAPVNPDTSAESSPAQPSLPERLNAATRIGAAELATLPEAVRQALPHGDAVPEDFVDSRVGVLSDLLAAVEQDQVPAPRRAEVALWIHDQALRIGGFKAEDLSSLPEAARQALAAIQEDVDTILSNPTLKTLIEQAGTLTAADLGALPEVTAENLASPEVQQAIQRMDALAKANPAGVDPRFVDQLLDQRGAAEAAGLSPRIISRLKRAAILAKEQALATGQKTGKTQDIVRAEILSEGKNEETQWGLTRHLSEIEGALEQGRVADAQVFLDNLRNFGAHMQGKADAAAKSLGLNLGRNNTVPYRTWTGSGWIPAESDLAGRIGISPFSEASLDLGRDVVIDARTVTNLYNNLLKAYDGELTGKPLPRVRAPKRLQPKTSAPVTSKPAAAPKPQAEAEPRATKKDTPKPDTSRKSTTDRVEVGPSLIEEDAPVIQQPKAEQEPSREDSEGEASSPAREASNQPETGSESRQAADPETRADADEARPDDGAGRDAAVAVVDAGVTAPEFPHLARDKQGLNRFERAYKIDPERSDLLTRENPAREAVEILNGIEQVEGDLELPYAVDPDKAKDLARLVETEVGGLIERLNQRLTQALGNLSMGTKKAGNRKDLTALEALARLEEKDFLSFPEAKMLALVDPATGKYDPRLIQAAGLAAVHWALNAIKTADLKHDQIAKAFGVSEAEVTPDMVRLTRLGLPGPTSAESLSRTILEFWGAVPNRKAPISDIQGVAQSLAAEMLVAMEGRLVTEHTHTPEDSVKTYRTVEPGHKVLEGQVSNIGGMKRLLADIFVPGATRSYHFEAAPDEVKSTQKKNRLAQIGEKARRALARHQEVKFYRTSFVDLMWGLGRETYLRLNGHVEFDPETTNINHAKSLEGSNRGLERAWDQVIAHDEMVGQVAKKLGKEPGEVATHYTASVGSNARIMYDGFTPQADKTARAAFAATIATLDLSKKADRDRFWFTIGQATGLVKTEYAYRESGAAAAEKGVGEKYPRTLAALRDFVATGEITPENRVGIQTEIAGDGSPQLLAALLAVAEYRFAEEVGGDAWTAFRHAVPLEADGKTDGPIAAMIHFIRGAFKPSQVLDLARGGVFLGSKGRTLNQHYQEAQGAFQDLYARAAELMKDKLHRRLKNMNGTPAQAQKDAFVRVMNAYMNPKDFHYDPASGEITIGRNELKNPLTITVYGSGTRGIAGKVANILLEKIYEDLSRQARGEPTIGNAELAADLQTLFSGRVLYNPDLKTWVVETEIVDKDTGRVTKARPRPFKNAATHTFSEAERMFFMENIHTLYVGPMKQAIDEITGDAKPVLDDMLLATSVQGEALIARFEKTVQERLDAQRKSSQLGPNEFLTQEDYDAIFEELSRYGVVITDVDSDAHYLDLSSPEKAEINTVFAGSLDRKYSGKARVAKPSRPGVGVLPMLTISRGDAMMMTNFFASREFPDAAVLRTLQVFDGLEMPADGIDTISRMINQALTEAYLENPVQDFADSFADWMRQGAKGPLDGLDQATVDHILVNVLKGQSIEALRDKLHDHARSIQARKNTMRRVGLSNDHMASGENAHVLEGTEEIQTFRDLDRIYQEELKKLEEAAGVKQPVVEKPNKAFLARVKALGTQVSDTKVVALTAKAVLELLNEEGVSADTRRMAALIAKALPNFTFYFGSSDELTALRDRLNPDLDGQRAVELGQTDLLGGNIFIANQAGETVLHEMLHAATARLTYLYYSDRNQLTPNQRAAVENLEQLLVDFDDMDFSKESPEVQRAAARLKKELDAHWDPVDESKRGRAMQEFIAWTLSNQNLIDVLRKSRVRSPLQRIIHGALEAIRKLFGLAEGQPMDIFSNIALNASELFEAQDATHPSFSEDVYTGDGWWLLDQRADAPSDLRLEKLMRDFETKVKAHLAVRRSPEETIEKVKESRLVYEMADEAVNLITSGGFRLDDRQLSAFRQIQAALASSMQLDPRAMIRIQKLFTHVTEQIPLEGFNDLVDRYGAQKDTQGRSTLLASFLALSQVDPQFREVLAKTKLPKDRELRQDSLDAVLTSMAESLMNTLATTISGEGHASKSALQSLDRLTEVLARIEQDDRTVIERKTYALLGTGDEIAGKFLSRVGERMVAFADGVIERERQEGRKTNRTILAEGVKLLSGLVDETQGEAVTKALTSFANTSRKIPVALLEMMHEVFGITNENRGVYELVNRVKYAVSGMRQDYREALPKLIAEQFSRELSKEEWSRLHLVLGKTDIAALGESFSAEQIRKLLTDKQALDDAISGVEERLTGASRNQARDYFRKAEELAEFMVTGRVSENLLRNAEAIARQFGEKKPRAGEPDPGTVQAVDELVTLYALRKIDGKDLGVVADLAGKETKGIDFLTHYLRALRAQERAKPVAEGDLARFNGWKGHIPSEIRSGSSLIVANESDHNKWVSLGYTRIGDYKGSGVERGKRAYYVSTVAGRNAYQQGVMQTIQTSAFGVDPRTGRSVGGFTAGHVPTEMVGVLKGRLAAQRALGGSRTAGEPLLPIYDGDGNVVGYERSMAPEMLARLDRNTHLGEMIGAWAGRQAEEELAQGFNRMLVDRLQAVWDDAKIKGRKGEFVNLADPNLKDPVLREAWKMVPPEMRTYIRQKFGDDGFMVRRDMVNNAVGYRSASVGDLFTEAGRHGETTRKVFRDTATVILGKDAFRDLVTAEKFWQAGISMAKHTIVIRSIIVPLSNLASNFLQLTAQGVGLRDIAKGFPAKLVEIEQHLKNLSRRVEIKALKARHREDPAQLRRLEAEEKLLDDADKRMSIWPLIEAGEFSTISEGQTEVDAAIADGKWSAWIQEKLERVPARLGTLGRYAVITRDTALFKGMARATQYGDFLAKAVLYEHLTRREGKSKEAALAHVTEEFVNYNLLPGRTRSYVESMGLTWFWAYKLRSIKVAHRTIRDHPLRALLTATGGSMLPDLPGISVGSPVTDNFLSVAADNRLGYSIGPGMLFRAPSLNPWVNIMN